MTALKFMHFNRWNSHFRVTNNIYVFRPCFSQSTPIISLKIINQLVFLKDKDRNFCRAVIKLYMRFGWISDQKWWHLLSYWLSDALTPQCHIVLEHPGVELGWKGTSPSRPITFFSNFNMYCTFITHFYVESILWLRFIRNSHKPGVIVVIISQDRVSKFVNFDFRELEFSWSPILIKPFQHFVTDLYEFEWDYVTGEWNYCYPPSIVQIRLVKACLAPRNPVVAQVCFADPKVSSTYSQVDAWLHFRNGCFEVYLFFNYTCNIFLKIIAEFL
jgi:hypothetical protein